MSMKRNPCIGLLLAFPLILFMAGFVLWPMSQFVAEGFSAPGLAAFHTVLGPGRYRTALENSVCLSVAVSIAALSIAFIPGWILARERFPGRNFLRTALILPLTFSGVLFGFLMVVLLGYAGVIPKLLGLLTGREWLAGTAYTLLGLFLAYLYFEVPRAVIMLEPAFRRFPAELDWAAQTLGAGFWARLWHIVLPILAPSLLSTLAAIFSTSLGSFGVALILSRRFTVAPLEAYIQLTGFLNETIAGVLCLILASITIIVDRLLNRSAT